MCECINRIKDAMEEQFKKTIQGNEEFSRVCFDDSALIFGDDITNNIQTTSLQTVSHVSVDYKKKSKSGKISSKNKIFNISHKFCPFCGEKY